MVIGELVSGGYIDAHTAGVLSYAPPALPSAWYGGSRWLQYYLRLWEEAQKPEAMQCPAIFSSLAQWYCQRRALLGLWRIELIFMHTYTPPPGENSTVEQIEVWAEECW